MITIALWPLSMQTSYKANPWGLCDWDSRRDGMALSSDVGR